MYNQNVKDGTERRGQRRFFFGFILRRKEVLGRPAPMLVRRVATECTAHPVYVCARSTFTMHLQIKDCGMLICVIKRKKLKRNREMKRP